MLFERGAQILGFGSLRHFWQSLEKLVLGAIDILQFVFKQLIEGCNFHTILPLKQQFCLSDDKLPLQCLTNTPSLCYFSGGRFTSFHPEIKSTNPKKGNEQHSQVSPGKRFTWIKICPGAPNTEQEQTYVNE